MHKGENKHNRTFCVVLFLYMLSNWRFVRCTFELFQRTGLSLVDLYSLHLWKSRFTWTINGKFRNSHTIETCRKYAWQFMTTRSTILHLPQWYIRWTNERWTETEQTREREREVCAHWESKTSHSRSSTGDSQKLSANSGNYLHISIAVHYKTACNKNILSVNYHFNSSY